MWSFYKSTRCSLDHLKVCWRTWSSGFGVHAAVSKANWGHIKNKTAIQIVFIKFDSLSLYIYSIFPNLLLYIYAFSRCFYPKWLTVHSGNTFFVSMCDPWELNPQPFCAAANAMLHHRATGTHIISNRYGLILCWERTQHILINSYSQYNQIHTVLYFQMKIRSLIQYILLCF